ncbi:MAG: hypothetical protein V4513_06635 [Pseudomonadota bacterium]
MRKLILSLAAAGTALAVATPAAAQYYPQPAQPYAYGQGYGAPQYDYRGQSYGLQMRAEALTRRIDQLRRANVLRGKSAERLRKEARSLQRRIRQGGGYGYGGRGGNDLQMRLARLEQRVNEIASRGRYGGYGYNGASNGYGYNAYANGYGQQGYGQRDRDDDDRYERNNDDRYDRDDD